MIQIHIDCSSSVQGFDLSNLRDLYYSQRPVPFLPRRRIVNPVRHQQSNFMYAIPYKLTFDQPIVRGIHTQKKTTSRKIINSLSWTCIVYRRVYKECTRNLEVIESTFVHHHIPASPYTDLKRLKENLHIVIVLPLHVHSHSLIILYRRPRHYHGDQ